MNLVRRNSFPKLSKFPKYFTQLGKFRGEARVEKHADPGKKNRNSRKSRDYSRNLLEVFLRSEENLYGYCEQCPKNSFKRLYTLKRLLILVEKASFSKEFRSEFHSGGGGQVRNVMIEVPEDSWVLRVRCLWFPTSDRLETWLILS